MPVPMTTGQLRSKVADMEIGDYIKSSFYGNVSTYIGVPNGYVKGELPVTGSAYNVADGFYYMIKVAKGLLIADRVTAHTITWDYMNTNKLIQGVPWDSGNIIPTMTSNTSPSGVASTSSVYASGYDAWRAFDKVVNSDTGRWLSAAGTSAWLQYDFGEPKTIQKYTIVSGLFPAGSPKDWVFEASNTGAFTGEQVVLDRQYSQTGWTTAKRGYTFVNSNSYRFYRITVTANNGHTSYLAAIEELEMMETVGIIRSLTGGVAYADANGNKSTTDASKGGWPTNNEWDRYIVNFPQDKIQAGKTLDDVFHFSNLYTWTQDTFYTTSGSTYRTVRGGVSGATKVSNPTSSSSGVGYGFRPVFSYREE
jgi:F5/8 type C domain